MNKSKIIHQILILILVAFSSNILEAQTNQQLYNGLTNLNTKSISFFKKNNIQEVVTISSRYFAPDPNGKIDFDLFTKSINEFFPNPSSKGFAALDWEANAREALRGKPNSKAFKDALNQYLELITFAKKIRPNIKWGYYSIPFNTYWNRDANWQQLNKNILPLLNECDILYPSLYIYYKEGSVDKGGNLAYARDNMMEFLKLANMVKKPVLPYVWNRYHNSNKILGMQLIPLSDFSSYIKAIVNTSYLGQKAAGVVWWGADQYFYNVKTPALVNEFKKSVIKNFKDYDDDLTVEYGTQMLKAIKGK